MLYVVVNAGTKEKDFARIAGRAGDRAKLSRADNHALLALQGPDAGAVIAGIAPATADMTFMQVRHVDVDGQSCVVSRSRLYRRGRFRDPVSAGKGRSLRRAPAGRSAREADRPRRAGLAAARSAACASTGTTSIRRNRRSRLRWRGRFQRRGASAGIFPARSAFSAKLKNGVASKRVGIKPLGPRAGARGYGNPERRWRIDRRRHVRRLRANGERTGGHGLCRDELTRKRARR